MGPTIALGIAAALCWGVPDLWLAQAARRLGARAVVLGSLLIGFFAVAPAALFVETPEWTVRGVVLGIGVGAISVIGYTAGFTAFREGAVSVVAPIIACEGGIAAVLAIAAGERLGVGVIPFIPVAVLGVVLAAMGRGGGKAAVVPAVSAAVIWGGILVLTEPVANDLGVYWTFFVIRASALAFSVPLSIPGGAWRRWTEDPWRVAAWGLGDAAAYLLFVAAADRGPVAVAGVLAAQFATIAVLMGMVFGGERLLRRQFVGVALVIVAVTGIAAAGG